MKNMILKGLSLIFVFIIVATVIEIIAYTIVKAPPPEGFGWRDLGLMIPTKILWAGVFIGMFKLAESSKLGSNPILYGFLWWMGASIPAEVGFWMVFKYPPSIMLGGILAGLELIVWGAILRKWHL